MTPEQVDKLIELFSTPPTHELTKAELEEIERRRFLSHELAKSFNEILEKYYVQEQTRH